MELLALKLRKKAFMDIHTYYSVKGFICLKMVLPLCLGTLVEGNLIRLPFFCNPFDMEDVRNAMVISDKLLLGVFYLYRLRNAQT